jgi:hypothetical protein
MNTKLMIASRTSEPPVHARSAATCSVDLTRLDFSNNYHLPPPTMFDSLALFGKSLARPSPPMLPRLSERFG